MATTPVQHVALIGVTGNLGSRILPHLLSLFPKVTALTRPESNVDSLPKNHKLTVARVASTDHARLVEALKGVNALIITQNMHAPMSTQLAYIDAAVEAGVTWIIPNEYGSDNDNAYLSSTIPVMREKKAARDRVEEKAKELNKAAKWIGVITNPWYDFSLQVGFLGVDAKNHTGLFFDNGSQPGYTTTLDQAALAIARLLALPITSSRGQASLQDYANGYIYVNSFKVSQADILASVQRVTNTEPSAWKVSYIPVDEAIEQGKEALKRGEFHPYLIYGYLYKSGYGGLFEGRELANEKLELPKEDLDAVTKKAIETAVSN